VATPDADASNSHFETNFECCSAYGAATLKIGFLKGSLRMPFKKPILIMRIAALMLSIQRGASFLVLRLLYFRNYFKELDILC